MGRNAGGVKRPSSNHPELLRLLNRLGCRDDGLLSRGLSLHPDLCEGQILLVQFDAGERLHTETLRSHGRGADAKKGIEQAGVRPFAMELQALLDESDGKGRGVRPILVAGIDGVVGNEPGVSPAAAVLAAGVAPAGNVRLVLIRQSGGAAVERDVAGFLQ